MLALGAKISGNRYTAEDLVTLSALANQTAVALENARLVENLVQLNTELRQAYATLTKPTATWNASIRPSLTSSALLHMNSARR